MHTQKVPVCWLISSAALNFGYILNLVIQLKFISQNSFNFNLSIITLSNISLTGLIFKEASCKRSGEQGTYPNRRKCLVKKMPKAFTKPQSPNTLVLQHHITCNPCRLRRPPTSTYVPPPKTNHPCASSLNHPNFPGTIQCFHVQIKRIGGNWFLAVESKHLLLPFSSVLIK